VPVVSVSRSTAFVLVSALLAILVLAGGRLARTGTASAPEIVAPLEPVSSVSATSPARAALVVHVVGAVRRPGLYRLREGARVADAVARAGGSTRRAELAALNLAAPLVDGVQVLVPERVAAARGVTPAYEPDAGAPDATIAGLGSKVSLATATAEELDELPGVGPVTAQKILDYRAEHGPFRSVEELDAVPGIGPTRVEQLRDHVTP
jgi:competence protein ComEA